MAIQKKNIQIKKVRVYTNNRREITQNGEKSVIR